MNQISRTIEYALLKADELTPAEIGTATGYAANEVQAGLKALVEAKLAHKAGKAWRWGVPTSAEVAAPTKHANGTYQSEPHPATLARPGGQDAYRLPSRYGDRLDPLKGHKGYVTPDGTFVKEV